jgi:GNAT superfamily N-acetyltransferase
LTRCWEEKAGISINKESLRIDEIPLGDSRIRSFAQFPWTLYHGNSLWTPPLTGDLLGNRLLRLVGLLTPQHPYHKHAEVTHFLAYKNGRPAGRISAAINHRFNEYYNSKIGFFGFFEVINDYSVAEALLERARVWVKAHGMTILRGPGEYSNATHERQGILIEGFEYPPMMELTHNPPYYQEFVEKFGFVKAKDYYAYLMDVQTPPPPRLADLAKIFQKRRQIETRELIMKDLRKEVRMVVQIYNDCWSHNWGFLPITDEEADAIADSLQMVADPGLVRFAFVKGEPAAVMGAFPDPYYPMRPQWKWYGDSDYLRVLRLLRTKNHIPRIRLMFFGVRPDFRNIGIDAILFNEVKAYAIEKGYVTCEASLLLEDNHLILSPSEFMGAKRYKTWRIYDLPLR